MTYLTLDQMEKVAAADANTTAAWICGIWAAGRFLKIIAFSHPVAACAAMAVDFACTVYEVGNLVVNCS